MEPSFHSFIVENLCTSVVLLNDDLRIEYANPAAESLLNISARHLTGLAIDEVFCCEGRSLSERLYEFLLVGRPYTEREVRVALFGERPVTVNFGVNPILDTRLVPTALLEITQLDQHLRMSREDQAMRQQAGAREMIRGLAHEIKNPLGGLRGAAQLLESELTDVELKDYTRIIIGEADRLRNLVDRMLGPTDPLIEREVDVHDVLEHVRRVVEGEMPEGAHIDRDYDPSLPTIRGDRDLLIQAVMNLVRNALQAVGGCGRILLRTRIVRHKTIGHTHHRLAIKADIIDSGPGIPRELQDRLFYPLVTGRREGSGLGLSIAQTLIDRHQGTIEFTSRPGHTVFSVLLPTASKRTEDHHSHE